MLPLLCPPPGLPPEASTPILRSPFRMGTGPRQTGNGFVDFELNGHWLGRVLAALPEFVLVVDRSGIIKYINRVEPGYEIDEVVGMSSTDFLFPESDKVLEGTMDRVFETQETTPFEGKVRLPDGSTAWYGGEAVPLIEDGVVVAALLRADNITELKAVQRELEQVKTLLPMCAWCGRIQTESGEWESVSSYLKRAADTDVSHGLCPRCEREQFDKLEAG